MVSSRVERIWGKKKILGIKLAEDVGGRSVMTSAAKASAQQSHRCDWQKLLVDFCRQHQTLTLPGVLP